MSTTCWSIVPPSPRHSPDGGIELARLRRSTVARLNRSRGIFSLCTQLAEAAPAGAKETVLDGGGHGRACTIHYVHLPVAD